MYQNVTHYKCTFHGSHGIDTRTDWCATDRSSSYRKDGKYGDCVQFCPEEVGEQRNKD